MSFFYLYPVKGEIPMHLLETILMQRIEFLKKLVVDNLVEYNEYMVEDSIFDNVGHFMICIATKLAGNTGFSKFIFNAEAQLFKHRLAHISSYNLRCFAKKIIRYLKKQEKLQPQHVTLQVICQHLMIKCLAQHITQDSHDRQCKEHTLEIAFQSCLPFVAKRLVELKNGIAYLPCSLWLQYLTMLFSKQLTQRLYKTDINQIKADPRIKGLIDKIEREAYPYLFKYDRTLLLHTKVDSASVLFPPCMKNLHQQLRKKHRLSHSQRFYYSLFLKDIGMPVEEAVEFWRKEYRLNPNGGNCSHHWEKDEKKYLYGIRHMYGLEGAKKNYTSVNCKSIQNSNCSEGGCPFKSFDFERTNNILGLQDEGFLSQINELKELKKFSAACKLYLNQCNSSGNCDKITFSLTPVNFYLTASKTSPS